MSLLASICMVFNVASSDTEDMSHLLFSCHPLAPGSVLFSLPAPSRGISYPGAKIMKTTDFALLLQTAFDVSSPKAGILFLRKHLQSL